MVCSLCIHRFSCLSLSIFASRVSGDIFSHIVHQTSGVVNRASTIVHGIKLKSIMILIIIIILATNKYSMLQKDIYRECGLVHSENHLDI